MSKQYDVLIVGSGTAGQTAAYELNRRKLRVGVVDNSQHPGGTCALSGCQAKKWFYEGAETVARSRHLSGIGITSPARALWGDLRDAKNKFTSRVPSNTVEGLARAGIDFIQGHACFMDHQTMVVDEKKIVARFFILATGAVPMPLPFDGAHLMVNSTQFMELGALPACIVFVGGGFISFEFAHFAARLGPDKISLIILEAGPRPLGPFDEEMVRLLGAASASEGIDIQCDVTITRMEKQGQGIVVTLQDDRRIEADLVVHGAGRIPHIADLELEKAGIDYSSRGINVNGHMATTNPSVYAVGDCAATIQLARVGDFEAQVAAAHIHGKMNDHVSLRTMDYTAVPSVLFTYPQYGMVGATEQALKKQGVAYNKSFAKDLSWPTYQRVGMKSAAYKLLADKTGHLLGAHVLSDNATGLTNIFTLAMKNHIRIEDLYHQSIMTPYPSRESDVIYMLRPLRLKKLI